TENDAGLFIQRVQEQTFEFEYNDNPGEIKTISIEFFPSKEYGRNNHTIYKIQITQLNFHWCNLHFHLLTTSITIPVPQPSAPETSKALLILGTLKVPLTLGTMITAPPE
ncbi:15926_t:CDS:2, partial [Funneliformis caledonium]